MREEIQDRLLALNQAFYETFADPFAQSRANPQPGFERLLWHLPRTCRRALDVGCGEGRFGRFLKAERPEVDYVGVDFSESLLRHARDTVAGGRFERRDVSRVDSLHGLGTFDLVVCLALLQHIPGRGTRMQLLAEMGRCLEPGGRLFVSTWQFMDSQRQRSKVVAWELAELGPDVVEENDYLMTWGAGDSGLRYVAHIDQNEIEAMARESGLRVEHTFRSDGLEGNLNLYAVLSALARQESM